MKRINKKQVEKEVKLFKRVLLQKCLTPVLNAEYERLYRFIMESLLIPDAEIIRRARYIRPMVRFREAKYNSCGMYIYSNGCFKTTGGMKNGDVLVFAPPCLDNNFIQEFGNRDFIWRGKKLVTANKLTKVCEFPVYSNSNFAYSLYLTEEEVLRQISVDNLDPDKCYACELNAPFDAGFYNCSILDRHIVPIILYEVSDGFPPELMARDICFRGGGYVL